MSGILYHHLFSAPSRSVLLTIRNLGLNVQVKNVDIFKGEQHSPEYLKINPLNQVPAFVDGDFVLTESKAISMYLANSRKSPLYPTDYRKRAFIDSKLFFDSSSLFPALRDFYVSLEEFLIRNCGNLLIKILATGDSSWSKENRSTETR
jgi:glutathione S-transferase